MPHLGTGVGGRYYPVAVLDEEMPYDEMSPTEFEGFCFELMTEPGFVNVDWRRGTGLDASPADSGRDIVADWRVEDVDGSERHERWFVDCKHYKQGVPPEKIQGLLAWASAERADVALITASNHLSNPCKDHLKAYEENNRPPFRVKHWERPQLRKLPEGVPPSSPDTWTPSHAPRRRFSPPRSTARRGFGTTEKRSTSATLRPDGGNPWNRSSNGRCGRR